MKTNSRGFVIPAVYFVVVGVLLLSGCKTPQLRIFQSKVPAPISKPAAQVEGERQAADYVARTITAPAESVPVAQKLSASLGEPEHRIEAKTPEKGSNEAIKSLADGLKENQGQLVLLNERLSKVDGKKIEGTGFNMFGFAVSLPVLGLIALAIFCPSSIGVMWWLLKKTKGALVATIQGVQDFKESNPDIAVKLNTALAATQDAAHKATISIIKQKFNI
jgi:hypothetical protein